MKEEHGQTVDSSAVRSSEADFDAQSTHVQTLKETKKNWILFLVCNLVGWPLNYLFALLIYNIESKHEENAINAFIEKKMVMGDEFKEFIKENNISKNIVNEMSILLEKSMRLAKLDPGDKKMEHFRCNGFHSRNRNNNRIWHSFS